MTILKALSGQNIADFCDKIPSFQGCVFDSKLSQIRIRENGKQPAKAWFVLYQPIDNPDGIGHWVLLFWRDISSQAIFLIPLACRHRLIF